MAKRKTRRQKEKTRKLVIKTTHNQVKTVADTLKESSAENIFGYPDKLIKQDLFKTIWATGVVILVLFGVFYFF